MINRALAEGWVADASEALAQLRFDNERAREDGQPARGRVKLDVRHLAVRSFSSICEIGVIYGFPSSLAPSP